jgi:membrane dipeptidase
VICINSVYLKNGAASPERKAAFEGPRQEPDSETATEAEIRAWMIKKAAIDASIRRSAPTSRTSCQPAAHPEARRPAACGVGADWDGGGGVIGFEDVADLPKVTARLKAEGYSDADVRRSGAATSCA